MPKHGFNFLEGCADSVWLFSAKALRKRCKVPKADKICKLGALEVMERVTDVPFGQSGQVTDVPFGQSGQVTDVPFGQSGQVTDVPFGQSGQVFSELKIMNTKKNN